MRCGSARAMKRAFSKGRAALTECALRGLNGRFSGQCGRRTVARLQYRRRLDPVKRAPRLMVAPRVHQQLARAPRAGPRFNLALQSVVWGKGVSIRVEFGGGR